MLQKHEFKKYIITCIHNACFLHVYNALLFTYRGFVHIARLREKERERERWGKNEKVIASVVYRRIILLERDVVAASTRRSDHFF